MTDDPGFRKETLETIEPTPEQQIVHLKAKLATAEADLAAAREMGERECERAEHWFREWEAAKTDAERLAEALNLARSHYGDRDLWNEAWEAGTGALAAHEQRVGKEGEDADA